MRVDRGLFEVERPDEVRRQISPNRLKKNIRVSWW